LNDRKRRGKFNPCASFLARRASSIGVAHRAADAKKALPKAAAGLSVAEPRPVTDCYTDLQSLEFVTHRAAALMIL
jgi:hypothetical protein